MTRAEVLDTAKQYVTQDRNRQHGEPERRDRRYKWLNPSATPTYYVWRSMRQRCTNPRSPAWANYGGRGVRVCDRWASNYDDFVADMGLAPEGMTLDRIDFNGDYEPGNCRWVGWDVQSTNKRTSRYIEHDGKRLTLSQWASLLGVGSDTLFRRLNVYNMPIDKALSSGSLVPVSECGTRHKYEKGCRCSDCKAAHAARFREIRRRRKASLGEARQ